VKYNLAAGLVREFRAIVDKIYSAVFKPRARKIRSNLPAERTAADALFVASDVQPAQNPVRHSCAGIRQIECTRSLGLREIDRQIFDPPVIVIDPGDVLSEDATGCGGLKYRVCSPLPQYRQSLNMGQLDRGPINRDRPRRNLDLTFFHMQIGKTALK